MNLESKYTQHRHPRGARISGPVLKCVILATFKGQPVQRPLEALLDPHNHSKASKLTKKRTLSQNTPKIDYPRGATISGPVLKCVILATFKCQLVQRPLEALVDPHNHSKASKLTKKRTLSQNTPNIDSPRGTRISGPVLNMVILSIFKGIMVQRPLEALGDLHNLFKSIKIDQKPVSESNYIQHRLPLRGYDFWPSHKMFDAQSFLKSTLSLYPSWAMTQFKSKSTLTSSLVFCQF